MTMARGGDHLNELIGGIYDAAIDAARWPDVLRDLAEFTGAGAAGLLSKDSMSKVGDVHYNFGVDEAYITLYREGFWRLDPLAPLLFFPVGRVTTTADVTPVDEFRAGRFYQEWVRPQGFADAANVLLHKSPTSCSILSIITNAKNGDVDDKTRRRVELLVPHVSRAALIGRAMDVKAGEAAAFTDALDGLAAGVFLTKANGQLVHANAAGNAMLADSGPLFTAGGRLAARNGRANRALLEVIAAAEDGDAAVGARGVAVPLASERGDCYVAHVLPLTSGARRRAGSAYAAVAAVFVRKAALKVQAPPEAIAQHYRLTPSELRVLLAIVDVGGVPEVADSFGIAESTVKTHLGRLYEKTDAGRQADLVKIVAGFSSPFVN